MDGRGYLWVVRLLVVWLGVLLVEGLAGPVGVVSAVSRLESVQISGFSDIGEAGNHQEAVEALEAEGLFDGTECGPGLFCPNEPVKRWVMAVWLVRIIDGGDPTLGVGSRFIDVEESQWWDEHVERLAALGVTVGCAVNPARYCPDEAVTRGQMASLLKRGFGLESAPSAGFVDVGGTSHEASIDALFAAGVTVGCEVSPLQYCPQRPVSRGEMATFLFRASGLGAPNKASTAGRISFARDSYSEIMVIEAEGGNARSLTEQVSSSDPGWSPDGTQIVFTSQSYSHFYSAIFTANSDGSGLRQLTQQHVDYSPVWSPDGTRIAFVSGLRIFVMDADGENLQQITEGSNTSLVWSPDGTRIAFVGQQNDSFYDNEVFVVDADGQNQQQLTNLDSRSVKDLQWSPDGTRIVFTQYSSGSGEIYVVDAYSRDLTQLTRHNADDNRPVWSPDGTRIAFQSDRSTDLSTYDMVFLVDVDGANLRQLTHSSDLQKSDNKVSQRLPVWSPDGGRIAFQSNRDGDLDIFVVEVETGTLTQLTHNDYRDYKPVWSPGGDRIAFQSIPGGEQGHVEIFVVDADTGNLSQLTNNQYNDSDPIWSPDGAQIAFTRSYPSQIFIVGADGSNLVQLTDNDSRPVNINNFGHTKPFWSPDGSRIAYTKPSESSVQIFVVDPDDPSPRQLTPDIYGIQDLWWSPVGDHLAFWQYSQDFRNGEIFVIDMASATVKQLTTDNYGHRYAAWSPDGGRIAYIGKVNDREQIITVSPDGGNPQQLTQEGGYAPMWSPDGDRIGFRFQRDSGIFVMNADGSAPKKVSGAIPYTKKPAWSPDGRRIAFLGDASVRAWPEHDVFVVNADGTNLRQLTNNNPDTFGPWCRPTNTRLDPYPGLGLSCDTPGNDWGGDPVWSPDSTRIAYTLPVNGTIEVFVIEADGSNLVQITSNSGQDYPKGFVPRWREPIPLPMWSPDGTRIAFVSDRDGDYEVFVVNADGTNLLQLTNNHYNNRNPAWSPTG